MIIARIEWLTSSLRFRMAEWGLGAIMLGWGLILLLPFPSFDQPALMPLKQIASENAWGYFCATLGALRLAVLIVNGGWRKNPHARALTAFLSCFVWLQVALGLYASGVVAPGLVTYPVFLAMEMYTVFRAALDARQTDEAGKNGTDGQ